MPDQVRHDEKGERLKPPKQAPRSFLVPPVEELRAAAIRLTAGLDQAELHEAAAHMSMAADAMTDPQDPAVDDNVCRTSSSASSRSPSAGSG
ncbi:MAG TPA: hypothetical protein VF645_11485 [Allosphingosinicella sp.]|jgi:hypothetical protein